MNKAIDILIALTANLIGFFSVPICFYSLYALGLVSADHFSQQGQMSFTEWASPILIVWIICAVFSVVGLWTQQKGRYLLIAAPAIVPVLYGLTTVFLLS